MFCTTPRPAERKVIRYYYGHNKPLLSSLLTDQTHAIAHTKTEKQKRYDHKQHHTIGELINYAHFHTVLTMARHLSSDMLSFAAVVVARSRSARCSSSSTICAALLFKYVCGGSRRGENNADVCCYKPRHVISSTVCVYFIRSRNNVANGSALLLTLLRE